MQIDAVDFFYLSMPVVTLEADGSQDALLVRVSAGGFSGFGECEAAPLPSIAAFVDDTATSVSDSHSCVVDLAVPREMCDMNHASIGEMS